MLLFVFLTTALCAVHPISVRGRFFINSITKEPFYIKGVDYQPGGSSAFTSERDPLSDPSTCARDIALFQELGINTIRVYSVNAALNHDICMSLLASAGIYLVLDVNSPLPQHHLNRYEPWTSYNEEYLTNVFAVVEQFMHYNNTLGFFAGNEIINDDRSARSSPVFVKAIVRDIKQYIDTHGPRAVPVGYSAADDLRYRIPLAEYLECSDEFAQDSVDFYGVNTYQWCGEQTFYTSGYNVLVESYVEYSRPVFFSEFGCNEVVPRAFDEIKSIYSPDMTDVFQGGLVYEFTQEPNKYGLVQLLENGDVQLLRDYTQLQLQYQSLPELDYASIARAMQRNTKDARRAHTPSCEATYDDIDVSMGLPECPAAHLIQRGVSARPGSYVHLTEQDKTNTFGVLLPNGNKHEGARSVRTVVDIHSRNEAASNPLFADAHNCTYDSEYDSWSDSDGEDGGVLQRVAGFFSRVWEKVSSLGGTNIRGGEK